MSSGAVWRGLRWATVVLTVLPVLVAVPAGADEISDKKAEAEAIAAKLSEFNREIARNAEAANGARYELDQLGTKISVAEQHVQVAEAALAERRLEIRRYAVEAYVRGPDPAAEMGIVDSPDPNASGQRAGYLAVVTADRQQAIDNLRATQQDVEDGIAQLSTAQAAAEAKANDLRDRNTQVQALAQQQAHVYRQVQGELGTLVEAAQEREAAAEAARARERAEQAAALQPASPSPAPPSSPSSGDVPAEPSRTTVTSPRTTRTPPTAVPSDVPETDETTPSTSGGRDVSAVLAEARAQLGKPYVWAAAGPDSFDCSGFTLWAWRAGGLNLPHFSGAQYSQTRHVPMSDIQPGDLVFYNGVNEHVAIYLGGGQVIHAPNSRSAVRIDSLYWWDVPMVASRP